MILNLFILCICIDYDDTLHLSEHILSFARHECSLESGPFTHVIFRLPILLLRLPISAANSIIDSRVSAACMWKGGSDQKREAAEHSSRPHLIRRNECWVLSTIYGISLQVFDKLRIYTTKFRSGLISWYLVSNHSFRVKEVVWRPTPQGWHPSIYAPIFPPAS